MEIIGRILKENRIRKNLTVHEIAVVTKINSRIIKAIEEGNLDELPSKSFLRGFIRSYASYLKLNVDEILKTFQEELGSTLYQPSQKKKPRPSNHSKKKGSSKTKSFVYESSLLSYFLWGGALISLTFITISVRNLIEKYKNEGQVNFPPQMLNSVQSLKPKKDTSPLLNQQPELVSMNLNEENKDSKNKTLMKQTLVETKEIKKETLKKPSSIQKNETKWNELILEASEKAKVQLKDLSNNKIKEMGFSNGQIRVIKFKNPLQLTLNHPEKINIIYNGKIQKSFFKKTHIFPLNNNQENKPTSTPLQ